MTKLLMTAQNPSGWKLEDLLRQVVTEIEAKDAKIVNAKGDTAALYRQNNSDIIGALRLCAAMQEAAIDYGIKHPITL